MTSEVAPVFGHRFAEEPQDCGGELRWRWITSVVGDVAVHDGPEPLYRVEVWAIGRQLGQVDAAGFARQKRPDIRTFVVGCVVPNHVNNAFFGVSRLDFGQQLHSANAVDRGWRNDGGVEILEIQRAVNVDPTAPCRGFNRGVCAFPDPAKGGFALVFGVDCVRKIDGLVGGNQAR